MSHSSSDMLTAEARAPAGRGCATGWGWALGGSVERPVGIMGLCMGAAPRMPLMARVVGALCGTALLMAMRCGRR